MEPLTALDKINKTLENRDQLSPGTIRFLEGVKHWAERFPQYYPTTAQLERVNQIYRGRGMSAVEKEALESLGL